MLIKGLYTAMITPFSHGEVDMEGLKNNIEFQVENGADGILLLGTTGETPSLDEHEKIQIVKTGLETLDGRINVMVGTGTNSTKTTIENTKKYQDMGIDCALIVTPYYNKPEQSGIIRHFEEICNNTDIPIMVYNIQGRTGRNIETETLKKISEFDNIVGVKEASGSISQMDEVIEEIASINPDFSVMSGDDSLTFPMMCLGGNGVISVVSNLIPAQLKKMINAIDQNDLENARAIHRRLNPLFKGAFIETNPQPIKALMNMYGLPAGELRLPMIEAHDTTKQKLQELLQELNLI